MILGVGIDLVENDRFGSVYNRHGLRFLEKIFTTREISEGEAQSRAVSGWAVRFAAKEAVFKALGFPGFMAWQEIEILRRGRPFPDVLLSGRYDSFAGKRGLWRFHLSLTHSRNMSSAVAVWEAL